MSVLNKFADGLTQGLVTLPRWSFNCALLLIGAVGYSFLCFHVFNGMPRIDDSVAALFQARIFANGSMIWPMPANVQPWFDIFGVVPPLDKPDHWTGMYTPGWPLLLMVGVLLGTPWIVNPILGGLLCIVIAEITTDRYGKLTGRVAGIMALVSPYIGVVSASYLSHTAAALFVALAWWSTARLLTTHQWRWGLFAGSAIGFTILIRPEAALIIGMVIAVGTLIQWRRSLAVWRQLFAAGGVALVFVALLLAWQDHSVGKAGHFGHRIDMGVAANFGFGRVGDSGYVYTPGKARMHSEQRLEAVHQRILGWPLPAVILLLTPLLLARPYWRNLWHSLWLLMPLTVLTGLFYFYWYYEEWLPGRYFFPAVPFLVVLMAHGWHVWHQRLSQFSAIRALPALLLIVGSVFSLAYSAPQYHKFFKLHHGDVEDLLTHYLEEHQLDNALILYRSLGKQSYGQWNDYYATAFMQNDLDLKGKVVIARDGAHRKPNQVVRENNELFAIFPDRNYYSYTFNQATGRARMFKLTVENNMIIDQERMRDPSFIQNELREKNKNKKAKKIERTTDQ